MKHRIRAVVMLLLVGPAGPAAALGLGQLEKLSGFNERFEARIPVRAATADEISSLRVKLADPEAFERANIDRPAVLQQLRFELVEPPTGNDYIRITSQEPIREPFLNFLIELSWASGRLYREYTILLDPPLYDPGQRVAGATSRSAPAPRSVAAPAGGRDRPLAADRSRPVYRGGSYGPVQAGETLSRIAEAMRPDSSVTPQQMMLALLRANPEAFINDNINLIRQGAVLEMPTREQIQALSPAQAVAEVQRQHSLWEAMRQGVAAAPSRRPETITAATGTTAGDAADAGSVAAGETATADESRLRLVAADEATTNQEGGAAAGGDAELEQKLSLALENLESMEQENAELRDRLAENEALIEDLKRLIELKDAELAALQGRSAQQAAGGADEASERSVSPAGPPEFRRFEHDVVYPDGEPVIATRDDFTETLPAETSGPPPAFRQFEHEVVYPEGAPAGTDTAAGPEPVAGTDTVPEFRRFEHEVIYPAETVADEPVADSGEAAEQAAAGTAPAEVAPAGTGSAAGVEPVPADGEPLTAGWMGTVAGYLAGARAVLANNLVPLLAGLVALLLLVAGGRWWARRRADAEAQRALAEEEFPDFATTPAAVGSTTFLDEEDEPPQQAGAPVARGESAAETPRKDEPGEQTVVGMSPLAADTEQEEAEDPLAEVNVLMAYENFDQAEERVREAIAREPDNVENHAKLLEVFYAANNRKKYEAAARDLYDLTGGKGEHWDMAAAMWQEISPNRALFEGGADEDQDETAPAPRAGIVDITERPAAAGDTGTLDFNVLDSTTPAAPAGDSHLLELTAETDTARTDGEVLDITRENETSTTDMLDLTGTEEYSSMDATEELPQTSRQPSADDNAIDFTLDDEDSDDTYLLDVTRDDHFEGEDHGDVLDITAPGGDRQAQATDTDTALDFSLDDDREPASTTTMGLDLELEQESETELNDDGSLDQISEQLSRLEQTLGSLARQDTHTLGRGTTADALDGIDRALDELQEGNEVPAANAEPAVGDMSIDREGSEYDNLDIDDDDLAFETGDETYNLDSRAADREERALDFDLDDDSDEPLMEFDADVDESETREVEQEDEPLIEEDLALDTIKMDAVKVNPVEHGFDLELPDENEQEDDFEETVDMDTTVEMPKNRTDEDVLTFNYEAITDDGEGDGGSLYPAANDGEDDSQEDELTTKLDLAKAYVELGDSESARTILEEVMHGGNESQKREAGELLQQLS